MYESYPYLRYLNPAQGGTHAPKRAPLDRTQGRGRPPSGNPFLRPQLATTDPPWASSASPQKTLCARTIVPTRAESSSPFSRDADLRFYLGYPTVWNIYRLTRRQPRHPLSASEKTLT